MTHVVIGRTWDGALLPAAGRTRLGLEPTPEGLRIEVDAPFAGDPPPDAPAGSVDGLWEHEVVELFVALDERRYVEIELGPHGHHLVLELDGVRQVVRKGLPLRFEARILGDRWKGSALVDRSLLPTRPVSFNAYRIAGVGEARRYEAFVAVPGERPDFHRPDRFAPWMA